MTKELVIISGKGGTGKTCITASFGYLSKSKVMADCDVDAADLHIILQPRIEEEQEFRGGEKAVIDPYKCVKCGLCVEVCRYEAITEDLTVDGFSCEGCSVCYHVCPEQAITMEESLNGHWFVSQSRFGPMVHAALLPGEENSGKLVALVRNQAKALAKRLAKELVVVDGAPGIGCPVISSITGADHVMVVTEPSLSGLHDMQRVIGLIRTFNIPITVVINKFDINIDVSSKIEQWLDQNSVNLGGKIPYDPNVIKSMVMKKTVVESGNGPANNSIRQLWDYMSTHALRMETSHGV